MAELKKVRIGDILPNPFRDLEEWPTIKEKVDEIKASFEKTGFWAGYMQVRKVKGGYEQAFGHHRLVAARELWGEDHKVEVTVTELTDDEMFARMVSENSETYGQMFYYATMQPLSSLVKAYAEGRVELEKPGKGIRGGPPADSIRYAPSFQRETPVSEFPYTANAVGKYLGWLEGQGGNRKAAKRVLTALAALELIERKLLKANKLKGLSQEGVKAAVKIVRARMDAELKEADAIANVKEGDANIAEKNDDPKKAAKLRAEAKAVLAEAEEKALQAGKAAGTTAVGMIADGSKVTDVIAACAPGTPQDEAEEAPERINKTLAKYEKAVKTLNQKLTAIENKLGKQLEYLQKINADEVRELQATVILTRQAAMQEKGREAVDKRNVATPILRRVKKALEMVAGAAEGRREDFDA